MKPSEPPERKHHLERRDHRLVVGESVSPETVEFDDADDLRGISNKQDRTEDGTLGDTRSDRHCPGSSAVEPDELSAAGEIGLNPLDDSSCDAVVMFEPIEKDLMVDRVERRAEVEQAK